jgi:hypothetical protein
MDTNSSTVAERSTLTFCVQGLKTHEERMFKAYLRLIDSRTRQKWKGQALEVKPPADLLVLANGLEPNTSPGQALLPALRIGTSVDGAHSVLSWPLDSHDLEREMNRLGGHIIAQREASLKTALFAGPNTVAPLPDDAKLRQMRLRQWPPSRLLTGSGRMHLATLLTGKAMNLNELAYRSALPLPLCEVFFNELLQANLMVEASAPAQPETQQMTSAQKAVKPGLLTQIRMRLGISR